jgi:hypothetical protein
MGCGESKPVSFEGTPDEEVQHHATSIKLAAQSGEGGKGPEKRIIAALQGVITATEQDSSVVYPSSADKFANAIEVLRMEASQIYSRYHNEVNIARIAIGKRLSFTDLPEQESNITKINYGKLRWIPRVVNVDPTSLNHLGLSVEYGLTGPGAASLGFCVEAWVLTDQPKKNGEHPPLFSLLDMLDGPSRKPGMGTSFLVECDGRPCLDFHKQPCQSQKGKIVESGEWTHVACVYGHELMRLFINGNQVGAKPCPAPMGETAVAICMGQSGFVTEMRVWSAERSPQEINETMNLAISPYDSRDHPSLRLSWLPLKSGGVVRPSGSLLYDTWTRRPVGTRDAVSPIADSRWPCALPASLIPNAEFMYNIVHMSDKDEEWEQFQIELHGSQPVPKKYRPSLSVVENRALQIMSVVMSEGGPWVPRVVCLPPGTSACVGTTQELGLTDAAGFTVESWVRIRTLQTDHDSCILGIGNGDPVASDKCMRLMLRRGRPLFGLCGQEAECEVGLSRMRWTHVAFVWDGKSQQIYANGTLLASQKSASMLSGSSVVTIGSSQGAEDFTGDICEFRVWNRPLAAAEVESYMKMAIPPLGGKGHRKLRLTWLPLRNGGPVSQEMWMRRKLILNKVDKPLSKTSAAYVKSPLPTLLWDVTNMRDVGLLTRHSTGLLTSRTRQLHIPVFIPEIQELPMYWSKSAVGVIDDWTDCFDRAFVPKWYEAPEVDENDHEAFAQFPTDPAAAVKKGGTWVGRVMRTRSGCNYSVALGLTAEIGLLGVGTGGREMTLECWIRPRDFDVVDKKKIIFEDILGHEEASNIQTSGFFFKETFALRIGLANGQPFISLQGGLKSLKSSEHKEAVIAPEPIKPNKWTHLAFICVGDGRIMIFVNGEEVAKKDKMNPLQAKGDTMIHAFGYEDRLLRSDLCEMRLWSSARSRDEIKEGMTKSYAPLPSGLARVPELRLAWFPCISTASVFWDHKYIMHRATFKQPPEDRPRYSRRPCFLPKTIRSGVNSLPPACILDDFGDAFERHLSTAMVPPVVRKDDGTVDRSNVDVEFVPLKKAPDQHFASVNTKKEEIDIGWDDIDDGALESLDAINLDDGGWMEEWDRGDLESICEEVTDLSKFIPPVESSLPCSRRPSATADNEADLASAVEMLTAIESADTVSTKNKSGSNHDESDGGQSAKDIPPAEVEATEGDKGSGDGGDASKKETGDAQ